MVLVHFALLAVTVWPSVEMIPFIAHVASGTPLFFLLGVMPAALLAPVIRYSHFQIMVGTVLGLPMLFLLAGAGSLIQGSAWATPLVRAVFDVAIGMAAGVGYFAAESKLRELQ